MGTFQSNPNYDDQAWLAFRYVADELTAEEASTFELRLAEDQAAREAVAQAVELSAAVKLAIGETIQSPEPVVCVAEARGFWSQKAWLQPAAWMAVGAAACLAAVVCFYRPDMDENQPVVAVVDGGEEVEDSPAGSLAMVWAESRHSDSDELDPAATDHSLDHNAAAHADDDDPRVIAPGWLLAAVTRGEMTDDLHLSADDE